MISCANRFAPGATIALALLLLVAVPASAEEAILTLTQDNIGSLKKFLNKLPDTGGLVRLMPGTYPGLGRYKGEGELMIEGVLGADGARPRIVCAGGTDGVTLGSRFGRGSLILRNLEITGCANGVRAKKGRRIVLDNLYVHDNAENGFQSGSEPGMVVEVLGGEYARNGDYTNLTHNLYIGHVAAATVRGIHSHSANGGHALKLTARTYDVRDNLLETTGEGPSAADDPHFSTTLLDIIACSRGVVAGNTLVFTMRSKTEALPSGTGKNLLMFRNRQSITGCDDPPYDSAEFQDPAYWERVAAGGLENPDNPLLLHHFVYANRFVAKGPNAAETVAIANLGTYPLGDDADGEGLTPLPVPRSWVERSRVWLAGNAFEGVGVRVADRALVAGKAVPEEAETAPVIAVGEAVPDGWPDRSFVSAGP